MTQTKEEARRAILEKADAAMKAGHNAHVYQFDDRYAMEIYKKNGGCTADVFHFTPPRPVPADGVVVWVWEDDYRNRRVRVSTGKLTTKEKRLTCYDHGFRCGACKPSWPNWEPVVQGEE